MRSFSSLASRKKKKRRRKKYFGRSVRTAVMFNTQFNSCVYLFLTYSLISSVRYVKELQVALLLYALIYYIQVITPAGFRTSLLLYFVLESLECLVQQTTKPVLQITGYRLYLLQTVVFSMFNCFHVFCAVFCAKYS